METLALSIGVSPLETLALLDSRDSVQELGGGDSHHPVTWWETSEATSCGTRAAVQMGTGCRPSHIYGHTSY